MSICLLHNKELFADRAGLAISRPSHFREVKKLFVSKCSRLAVAVTGTIIVEDDNMDDFMNKLTNVLISHKDRPGRVTLSDKLKDFLEDRTIIAVTRHRAYIYSNDVLNELDLRVDCAMGSGNLACLTALMAGKGPIEAMRISSLSDRLSYLSDIDSIKMSNLLE